ncbi:acyl-CoA dehydrogenase C-terminal domain-containing protein [Gimibacter soli]|uniref:3-methylmercaptopropionyl-CoA dehydrogenase n=1 Tax=Gimibacter soli TaxID=3024400 RepID=A0AAE9XRS9_9PROT|nr:acyl-CoA dehydrogenase C-terminal domain-containing protein [Gimibacter soli]WCL54889.1 acyl-CoA dehydrogenase C-terminal domain-containing protein [Gimibacter soli]
MPSYKAPVKDMMFLLNDVLQVGNYSNLPGYADATPDLVSAILEEAAKFAERELQPLNLSGDQEGCIRADNGDVTTPKGFKEAYAKYVEGGWAGLTADPEFGGQGLPHVLGICLEEMMVGANHSFAMYPGLSNGAMAAIRIDGTQEQKETYLPKMVEGLWTGTMNLTEPHCGTDLGMLRTKADPQADGTYKITGTKIFISAGEHDMSDNIIHLVLARLPDAPKGTKGISLFIVPKFLVKEDGSLGERNGVICGSLEHKMGIHANSTCVMNYDEATGYLIGEPNKGLRSMFIMMNAARLGVGVEGLGHAEVAYQNAVAYAKDRLQGRSLKGPQFPDKPADPIIVHADVRRNLMNARSFAEAARGIALWAALLVDQSHNAPTEEERDEAEDLVGLLTPIIKGVFTDRGFESSVACQQVFGGHGYVAEWGMEQFVRDARISQIYEGANGIQALDLVGRKLPSKGGKAIQMLFKLIGEEIAANKTAGGLDDIIEPMEKALASWQRATLWLMQNAMANPDNAGAASTPYMHLAGHVILGYMWLKMARVSKTALEDGTDDPTFHENKLVTARYYIKRRMTETRALLAEIESGSEELMALAAEAF